MTVEKHEIEEILPKKPRKITEDMPDDHETFTDTAKIGRDSRGQFFVRFPRKVSELLELEAGDLMEFEVKMHLKEKKKAEAVMRVRK